jgi:predicted DNA-binding transcriptional regulator YafY
LRDTRAKEISKAELDAHLASGYGIFAGRNVEWASLRFTAQTGRWVSAQIWHPKQRAHIEKDGSYVLEIPYADDRELLMEILRNGADIEVLKPAALRKRVGDSIRKAALRYSLGLTP